MTIRPCLALCTLLALGCTPSDDKTDNNENEATTGTDELGTTGTDGTTDTGGDGGLSFVEDAADGVSVVAVEPDRYLGVWYEIASSPSPQQAACTATQAEYSLLDNGDIKVVNQCNLGSLDGDLNIIVGSASFVDDSYARLLVDFNLGFTAPYNVVELDGSTGDEPYEFAVVSSPGFFLWVLSRTPQMDPELYDIIVERAVERGLPGDTLIETIHPE